MLQFYSAGLIILFLFVSTAEGQLKEKAEELRLLFEKKSHPLSSKTYNKTIILPSAVIDSALYQEWYLNNWVNKESTIYTYSNDFSEETNIFRKYYNNEWNPEVRTTVFYDDLHNLTREIVELYDNNTWKFARLKCVTYSNGLITEEVYQEWSGEEWVNSSRYTSKYDDNKNQAELLVEKWGGVWVNDTRYTMLYDNFNNNTLLLAENWINGWQNLYRTEKVFNSHNLVTMQIYYQWQQSRWQQIEKITNSYNKRFDLAETLLQQNIENAWINELLSTFIYDSLTFKLAEAKDQRWNSEVGEWLNELHYIYKIAGDTSESIVQVWTENEWINNFRTITDEEDLLSVTLSMSWDGKSWVNSARLVTTYKLLTSAKELPAPAAYTLEQNYPNPFNPSTTITYSVPHEQMVTLKVYNILGQEVTTLVNETLPAGKHQAVFNAADLSSGIYYYRLETKGFAETKGMILIK